LISLIRSIRVLLLYAKKAQFLANTWAIALIYIQKSLSIIQANNKKSSSNNLHQRTTHPRTTC